MIQKFLKGISTMLIVYGANGLIGEIERTKKDHKNISNSNEYIIKTGTKLGISLRMVKLIQCMRSMCFLIFS